MTALLNPKYFAPIHGEIYMRHGHRDLVVRDLDFEPKNTFIMKNGQGIVLSAQGARLMNDQERVPAGSVMVELNEKIHDHVLADRTLMADGGVLLVTLSHRQGTLTHVGIRARGFRYMDLTHEIFGLIDRSVREKFAKHFDPHRPPKALESLLAETIQKLLLQKFKKEALIEVVLGG